MPFVHISLQSGKSETYRQAVFDCIYQAMHETFDVPEDDQFMALTEHDSANFRYGSTYLNINRSEDVMFIQITANNTRTQEQKKALFARIVALLNEEQNVRPEDVLISLVEVEKENCSLGLGIAQYA